MPKRSVQSRAAEVQEEDPSLEDESEPKKIRGPRGIVGGGKKNKKKKKKPTVAAGEDTGAASKGKAKGKGKSGGGAGDDGDEDGDEGDEEDDDETLVFKGEKPPADAPAIKKELQSIIDNFNYDTDSDLGEFDEEEEDDDDDECPTLTK